VFDIISRPVPVSVHLESGNRSTYDSSQ
jgi:hypothetical protein